MDLEFKTPNLESFYSPSHQQRSLSPIWPEKDKPEDDGDNATSDGEDQGSVHGTDAENSSDLACNESLNDALQWENGIGTLAGSNLKFRMNEHGDIEVITESLEFENLDDTANSANDENFMIDTLENRLSSTTNHQIDMSMKSSTQNGDISHDTLELSNEVDQVDNAENNILSPNEPETEMNEEKERNNQNLIERADTPLSQAKEEPGNLILEDSLPELDPVLSEDMTKVLYGGTAAEHKKEEGLEPGRLQEIEQLTEVNKSTSEAVLGETPKPSACIICGQPATLANRFCSRQCIGKNAARQRQANLSGISKKSKGGRKPLGKKRYHDYSSPQPNDVLTVVHDESPGSRNDLKIKIRWSSSISNDNRDGNYTLEPREVSKRQAAVAAGNYAYAGYIRGARRKRFSWSPYLAQENAVAAPPEAFEEVTRRNPFPVHNGFEIGMALEGVDPEHEALICPLFVAEVRGCRIRLSFCGYSGSHDFWRDADSPMIFPCGFCKETSRVLQPPKEYNDQNFVWEEYLKTHRLFKAPRELFATPSDCNNRFKVDQKLEAVDKHNPSLLCVATIQDVLRNELLIHFDGWSHNFDYWCSSTSKYIHPAGWCLENNKELSPPLGYEEKKRFSWDSYLNETKTAVADSSSFVRKLSVHSFKVGMKLEAVDPRNKILVRAATIMEMKDFQVKIHFDGWSDMYDFWTHLEDTDLHPTGWCHKTGHPLEPPVTLDESNGKSQSGGCPIPGCRGIGHVRGAKFQNHYSEFGCPYSPQNLTKEHIKDRLSPIKSRRSTQAKEEDDFYIDEDEDYDFLDEDFTSKVPKVSRKRNGSFHNPPSPIPARKRTRGRPELDFEKPQDLLQNIEIVSKWTADEVAKFVEEVTSQPTYGSIFTKEEIDGRAMLMLSQADILTVLRIKLGPAVKIYNAITTIKETQ